MFTLTALDELATKDFSVVEKTVGSFMGNSQALIVILDEVAKIHPFIQGIYSHVCRYAG